MWKHTPRNGYEMWTWEGDAVRFDVWCDKGGHWWLRGHRIKAGNTDEAKRKGLKLMIACIEKDIAAMRAAMTA